MRTFTIGPDDGGQRLDKFVMKATVGMPQSLLYKYIRKKCVKINGRRAEASDMVSAGDIVTMYVSDEFFPGADASLPIASIVPKLSVAYEDDNIIVCDKPAGVLVHAGDADGESSDDKNTLIGHIQAYLYRKGEYDPTSSATFAPALCNRIDRNTRGLVIAAKNAEALREMNAIIRGGCIRKFYLCAVHGVPEPRERELRGWLRREGNGVRVYASRLPGCKEIVTRYRVLKVARGGDLSLCEVELLTGRTHQIRAHMEYIGHPLLGEGRYGKNESDRRRGYRSQALCAYKLRFVLDGYDGKLSYLRGREIKLDTDTVDFMREFD